MYQLKLQLILYNWSWIWIHFKMVWFLLFSGTQICSCKCLKVVVCSHLTILSHQDMSPAKLASFGTCAFFPYLHIFLAVLTSWNTSIFSVTLVFHHVFLPTEGFNEAFFKQPVASSLCVIVALKSKNPSAVIKWLLFWNDHIYWQGTSHFKVPTRKLVLYLKDTEL